MRAIAILSALAGAAFATAAAAQPKAPDACPELELNGPSSTQSAKDPFSFTLGVSGPGDYIYNWSVSAGGIESGQGTPVITMTAPAGSFVTATVEVGGAPPECDRVRSASIDVGE